MKKEVSQDDLRRLFRCGILEGPPASRASGWLWVVLAGLAALFIWGILR